MQIQYRGTVVIKIGTDPLGANNSPPNPKILKRLARDVRLLKKAGYFVVVVTSGAVGAGKSVVHDTKLRGLDPIAKKQVWAAHGQAVLLDAWGAAFREVGMRPAQALWTTENLENLQTLQDAQNFMDGMLLLRKSVPLINANDTVDTRELTGSDNDQLGGRIIRRIRLPEPVEFAIITGVRGVYTKNPRDYPDAKFIPDIYLDDVVSFDASGTSAGGTGGMDIKVGVLRGLARDLEMTSHILSIEEKNGVSRIILKREPIGTTIYGRSRLQALVL
jgi:glutamate 5-kinase